MCYMRIAVHNMCRLIQPRSIVPYRSIIPRRNWASRAVILVHKSRDDQSTGISL